MNQDNIPQETTGSEIPTETSLERSALHSRFAGAGWYKHPISAVVGGAGGIGSWLTLFLARQGHDIHVFDFDVVEDHNIGGQIYALSQVGLSKVKALKDICEQLCDHNISFYNEKYIEDSIAGNIMFSCFDNMDARKIMFTNWYNTWKQAVAEGDTEPWMFIDGRLNAETAEFFCVTSEETAQKWLESWFPDDKVEDAPCTYKATSHCAAILAGMMVGAVNNLVANVKEGEQRSVPFHTQVWLPSMMVKTED